LKFTIMRPVATILSYTIEQPASVIFTFYNLQGQIVDRIEQEQLSGQQPFQWNATGLPAGMYYFRIQADDMVSSGKMIKL